MGVDDGDEDRECGRCHETMHIPPGAEPSEFCHDCAHSLVDELRARVADLSMLVRRLSRYAPPGPAGDALDYLKRHGLEGSPLRDAGNKEGSRNG